MQKYPIPDIIKRTPPGSAADKDGIESIIVDEVKPKNLGAAWEYLEKFLIEFRDIEGFRWHRKIYGTVVEVLKLVGMG